MKSLRPTDCRRVLLPVAALAVLLLGAGVLAQAGPALAWEYYGIHNRVARIQVADVTAYAGTNTFAPWTRYDAEGAPIVMDHWLQEAGVNWEAADAAARAIVNDANGYGSNFGGASWNNLVIPIREDAAPGEYTINVTTRSRDASHAPEASTTMTITVIGRPASLDARLNDDAFDPGDRLLIRATARDANGALATFTRHEEYGYGVPRRCQDCYWRAADSATEAVLETPSGYMDSGSFRTRVAANARPGEYRITVSHPATGSESLSFTVTGAAGPVVPAPEPTPDPGMVLPPPALPPGPASYTIAGHDAIAAGRTAIYTVTGTDADGGLPNLEGANAQVNVLVDGPGKDSVTISATDGAVTLNDSGVGTFAVQVAAGTAPTTVTLEAVGAIDADPVIRRLSIGTAMPDLGDAASLTPQAGTGAATGTVTLRWTPGANADRHWIAGIKVSDWDAGDFSNIIWTRADSNDRHTVTGLDAGAEYAFTVIAGRLVNGQTEWGSWAAIQRVTVPAAMQ